MDLKWFRKLMQSDITDQIAEFSNNFELMASFKNCAILMLTLQSYNFCIISKAYGRITEMIGETQPVEIGF